MKHVANYPLRLSEPRIRQAVMVGLRGLYFVREHPLIYWRLQCVERVVECQLVGRDPVDTIDVQSLFSASSLLIIVLRIPIIYSSRLRK